MNHHPECVTPKCTCKTLRKADEKRQAERAPGVIKQIAIAHPAEDHDAPPLIYAVTESGELWSLNWEFKPRGGYKQQWELIPGPTAKDRK